MKKIAIMPVKNEEWILEHSLNCASQFFDHIIVADQNSTDKTPEICKKFSKVVYIKNDSENYNEGNRRQLMLDKAREFTGNNFIINLAADEVFSANIMKSAIFNEMIKDKEPGTGFSFQWVQLWKTDEKYRDDKSVWSNLYRPFAFIDDRITNYEPGFAHLSLIPEAFVKNTVTIDNVKVLHYQFVDFERMLVKQRWARLLEFEHYPQSDFLKSIILNNKYYITKDESGLKLREVSPDWLAGYPEFKLTNQTGSYWHNGVSIDFINKYGINRLKWLDIWDYTWPKPIRDPRNFLQKTYHNNQYLVLKINNLIPKFLKEIIKKI